MLRTVPTLQNGSVNVNEFLKSEGFYFPVDSVELYTIDGKMAPVNAIINSNTRDIVGYGSPNYVPVDNEEAFSFIEELEGFQLEKFGYRSAKRTPLGHPYVIGSFPSVDILGDEHKVYIILENSFDGSVSLRATYCLLRIVCQNQFSSIWSQNPAMYNINHTKACKERLIMAQETMLHASEYLKNCIASAEALASIHLSNQQIADILNRFLAIEKSKTEKEKERKEAQKIEIIERLNNLDHENFKGTGLALLNSVTHFQSHVQPVKKTKENWEVKRFFTNAQTSLYSLGQMIQQAA